MGDIKQGKVSGEKENVREDGCSETGDKTTKQKRVSKRDGKRLKE